MLLKYKQFLESMQEQDFSNILPNSINILHDMFKNAGKQLFVVGGSIRDFLNHDIPKDFDLVTDATPDEVLSIISKKWRTTTQGESFFVVVVYTEDQPKGMEIATFREDVYGDLLGVTRNPITKFSTIDKDVERRDIPYNALFYDLDRKSIVDLVGGIEDLNNRITRFVGDPDMRIKEDPLRILRLCRFSARYDFIVEQKTSDSIKKNKDQLKIITKNRIWEEFKKAYDQVKDFTLYLNLLNEYDLWNYIFPNIILNKEIVKCDSFEVYLANLFKNNKVANFTQFNDGLIQKYLIPNDISRVVAFLIAFQDFSTDKLSEFYSKKKSYKIDNDIIENWINVAHLDSIEYTAFLKYTPITSSDELMKQGFIGKALGDEIKRLEIINFNNLLND